MKETIVYLVVCAFVALSAEVGVVDVLTEKEVAQDQIKSSEVLIKAQPDIQETAQQDQLKPIESIIEAPQNQLTSSQEVPPFPSTGKTQTSTSASFALWSAIQFLGSGISLAVLLYFVMLWNERKHRKWFREMRQKWWKNSERKILFYESPDQIIKIS